MRSAGLRALWALALLVAGVPARAQTAGRQRPLAFKRDARDAIGADMAAVAARSRMSVAKLERLLATDADLAYSPESQTLVYACSGLAAPFEGVERAEGAEAQPRLPADFDAGDAALIAAFAAGGAEDGHNHDHAGGLAALDTAPLDAALGATSAGPDGATVAAAVSAPPGGADPGIESVFKLHSRPGAAKRILLDFNGFVAEGTQWNTDRGAARITSPPYSTDSDPAFSDQEKRNMVAIWRSIAEDYAPWEIDVTTEDDGRSLDGNGVRVAIGGASNTVLGGGSYGGIAYVNTFGQAKYDPAYIFVDNLGANTKAIAEAASHEVGHRFGLAHDGVRNADGSVNEYYTGKGLFAPIMGTSYYRPISQWSKGEYDGATEKQDDLAMIDAYAPRRADDHGGAAAGATRLAPSPLPANPARSSAGAAGAIERSLDQDWFSFDADAGVLVLGVDLVPDSTTPNQGAFVRADADLRARVLSPSGGVVAEIDPRGGLLRGAQRVSLPARGTYSLAVVGTGDTDYPSGYGSLGLYRLSLEFVTPGSAGQPGADPDWTPGVPANGNGYVVKVLSYKVQARGEGARVSKVTLRVTDGNGAPAPGVRVTVAWSHVPDGGGPPAFPATRQTLTSSSRNSAGKRGTLTLSSPTAPSPRIRLTVESASGAGTLGLDAGQSDTVRDFTW